MGIAVPSQLWKASQQLNMALIGYSGLGLAGYGLAGLGGWAAPLAIHRDGPFLCGNGEHLINGLCKKKRSAEAEPEAWYGWRGYSGAPIAGGALVIGQNSVTPDYTPEQKGAAWGLDKREADSEADAYYSYGGYGLGYGLGYGGYGYGGLGYGYGKRSADSEADAYYGYGGYGLGYGLGYGGYGYGGYGLAILGKSAPCVNAANIPVPCAAPLGIWKREADSEADAYYGYGGLYGGYGGYGLGYGYSGYGYGKRSADSEADAYYGYGGYGGYGLGYGGYGYGGLGYGYGKRS